MRSTCSRRTFLESGMLGLAGLLMPSWARAQEGERIPLPGLRPAEGIAGPPIVSARAWAIADGANGRILWSASDTTQLAIASTTKIMTACVVLRYAAEHRDVLDETMTISTNAASTTGSSARIRTGDQLTVRQMLYGLLLPSGNDAATALAEHFGPRFRIGDISLSAVGSFVARMNRTAAELRLLETRYFDPHGLGRNHSSTRDLAKLAFHAMQDETFRSYVRTRRHECTITGREGMRPVTWNNTNRLLEMEGYDGLKTGTTTAAGSCLVATGRHADDRLIVVVLGCTSNDSRYVDARNLFRWAWRERGHRM